MIDMELKLAWKTSQGYADCSETLEEHENQIKAEVIDKVWNKLIKYQIAIENANYPFNFIQIAFDELREDQLKENKC